MFSDASKIKVLKYDNKRHEEYVRMNNLGHTNMAEWSEGWREPMNAYIRIDTAKDTTYGVQYPEANGWSSEVYYQGPYMKGMKNALVLVKVGREIKIARIVTICDDGIHPDDIISTSVRPIYAILYKLGKPFSVDRFLQWCERNDSPLNKCNDTRVQNMDLYLRKYNLCKDDKVTLIRMALRMKKTTLASVFIESILNKLDWRP